MDFGKHNKKKKEKLIENNIRPRQYKKQKKKELKISDIQNIIRDEVKKGNSVYTWFTSKGKIRAKEERAICLIFLDLNDKLNK